MNGNISQQGITLDLEAIKRVGIVGVQIFQVGTGIVKGPVAYGSAEHLALLQHAAREADRMGLEFDMHNCPGWSSSGGPWITPELSMQTLAWTETAVTGGQAINVTLPQPEVRLSYYRDALVLAFPTPTGDGAQIENWRKKANFDVRRTKAAAKPAEPPPATEKEPAGVIDLESVLDISSSMDAEGHLNWQAPVGNWTVLRIGHTTTGARNSSAPAGGAGLECDKFSRAAFERHFESFFGPLFDTLRPLAAKGLAGAIIDSYEVGMQNWTAEFPREFQKRRGYDLRKYMPAMTGRVVGSAELSDRFLWDVRKTQADLMAENYYGRFVELCHSRSMKAYIEPYDPGDFDEMRAGSFPDVPMGEFWQGQSNHHSVKLAASVAHVNGRRVFAAEAFTSQSRWTESPYSLKALGDFMYAQGLNRFVFHRYAHQPHPDALPGMTMGPWGAHLDRTNTWFEQGKVWFDYLARCQYLLQQGHCVADLLYFTGEDSPARAPQRSALKPEVPQGSDFDTVDAHTILTRLRIEDGRIVLPDGMTYRLLVLPSSKAISLDLLRKIRELVWQGMWLVVAGPKPEGSPGLSGYPSCDLEVRQIAGEFWGELDGATRTERTVGKGRVFWGLPLREVLGKLGVNPDFEFKSASGSAVINYTHRRTANADIYFIANRWHQSEDLICTFNVQDKRPELWNAETGEITPFAISEHYMGERGRRGTAVLLRLDPSGSVFVVFRRPGSGYLRHVLKDGGVAIWTQDFAWASENRPRLQSPHAFGPVFSGSGGMKGEAMPIPATEEPPAIELAPGANGGLLVWQNGRYDRVTSWPRRWVDPRGVDPTLAATRAPSEESLSDKLISWLDRGVVDISEIPPPTEIAGPWRVTFPPNLGAPSEVTLDKLISWTEHSETGVKYFSGTAAYSKQINVPADALVRGKRLYLDLGRVEVLAEVLLNGKNLGVLWKPPFRVDLTDAAHPGDNDLEIRVTNLWPNRLIGDEQLPAENEYTQTFSAGGYSSVGIKALPQWYLEGKPKPPGGRVTFATWKHYSADSPLLESGLIGPVLLRTAVRLPIE